MQLFEHLADTADEYAQRFRYVLALVLMRKRRLKVVESRRMAGGRGESLTLRETGTDRRHEVSCPGISDEEVRSVADRLREVLDMPEKWDQLQAGEAPGAGPAPAEPAVSSAPDASSGPASEAAGDAEARSEEQPPGAEPAGGDKPDA
jgi:hypothetical protein